MDFMDYMACMDFLESKEYVDAGNAQNLRYLWVRDHVCANTERMCLHVSRVFGCSFSGQGLFDGLGLFHVPFQSRAREKKEEKRGGEKKKIKKGGKKRRRKRVQCPMWGKCK